MYGLKKHTKQDKGGMIRGAGTGTSDDIKKNVPAGSYIMPADSTQQIGGDNLKDMGNPTPVNLSNGEFEMSPDQVHSVGVQALDAMKNQTHVPVNQPQLGFKPGQNKPELFFANGGMVPSAYPSADDIRRAQQNRIGGPAMRDVTPINRQLPVPSTTPSASPSNPAPTQGGGFGARMLSKAGNIAKGLGKGHVAMAGIGGAYTGYNTPTEDYRERFGFGEYNPNDSDLMRTAKDTGTRTLGVLSDVGNAASFGVLGRDFADKQRHNAESELEAQQKRYAEWNAKKQQPSTENTTANPFNESVINAESAAANYGQTASSQEVAPQATTQNSDTPYAIQQKGNSFSYANPAAAQQARAAGVPELQTEGVQGGIKRTNDPRGVANLMANTREMGASQEQINQALNEILNNQQQGFGARYPDRPTRTDEQVAERQQLMRDIRAPIQGARGMTSNQRAQLLEMQTGDDNRATTMYNTDANNATSQLNNASDNTANIAQTMMREQGANDRNVLSEQGQNFRQGQSLNQDTAKFNADFGLKNRQQNLTETKEGFGIRTAQRVEKLYEMYDKAETDEQRQSIQERINRYTGDKSESGNPYITVKRGEILDERGNTIQPAGEVLFNRTTGQTIDPLAQMQQSTSLPNNMTRQVGTSNGKPVYEDAQGNRFVGN